MLGPNMPVGKPLRLLRRIRKNPFAFIAERQVDRSRNLLPNGGVSLDLLADRFDRSVGTEEAVGQGLVFTQESQQEMLGFDIGRPELAGLVACEKDDAPGFLRI